MERQAIVAGRFYDADVARLNAVVDGYLVVDGEKRKEKTLLCMVPHAGYVFSGGVCGATLAKANLESTVLLLGPNHTGLGDRFALWAEGGWDIPGATVPVDADLASELLGASPLIHADTAAHVQEHSLEVILPFLHRMNPETSIVPISVSSRSAEHLKQVGMSIGRILKSFERPVSIVVSSDMSHYISHDEAKAKDTLALEAAVNLEPGRLLETVASNNISMCGVLPMTVGLYAALEMGATRGELTAYATSGEVSGDFDQVVGYAGVIVD
ncbi:AmmeMemoRadiSam system protein B [uncultured Pseudodesulfovibrio sp.]|uniref:AmmeMemoRadiSam system protein B n=1 Tax=uncultured Pseudodesulfovibrio sp. TaxID=2035858 RepID=UPI0029C81659|nr:AmmeMemoRadiSam system protein B [uncultured Pseudodesulfovibrio sp.]